MSRMRDGSLDDAPIFEDVRTFDGTSLCGSVDVVSGGFPCQPHSLAATHGRRGGADERNLWPDYLRIVRECRPTFVLGENVLGILSNGYAVEVMAGLEGAGYCVTPCTVRACDVGGPFERKRVFFIAHSNGLRRNGLREKVKERKHQKIDGPWMHSAPVVSFEISGYGRLTIPDLRGMEHGMGFVMDRLRLCGNGVVPQQSAPAWQKIKDLAGIQ